MEQYDLIIRGGTIVDGLLTPRYVSDLAIKDGRIAQIGGLRGSHASRELDASGLIVGPGFIDLHTHYDAQIQWDPYLTLSGWHGVTTVVIGNCGFGFAPCRPVPEDRERAMLCLTRNEAIPYEAMVQGMSWDWVSFPDFLDNLDQRVAKGVNMISYVPLTPVYAWVMGWDGAKSRRPTETELREMCRLVEEGMDAGACGWSAQVMGENSGQRDYDGTPMITDLMTDEEILAFGELLARRDAGTIELTYAKVDGEGKVDVRQRLELYERLAEASKRPILLQAVQPDDRDPNRHRQTLAWLEESNRKGLRIYGQGLTLRGGFEFTFEDWNLFDESPIWRHATVGSLEERKQKLSDPEIRAKMKADWDAGIMPDSEIVGSVAGLVVTGVGRRDLEVHMGMSVAQIAEREGKHVIDACLDLAIADDLQTEFLGPRAHDDPRNTAEVVRSPYVIPGFSDGGAHVKFVVAGNFPTETITWLVKETGMISLEEAHYKLSYLPGFFGGVRDRGFIREGAPADLVVYDLEQLELEPEEILHDLPGGDWRRVQRAKGYRWTLVNGEVTFEDGVETGAFPGKLLRHGQE